MRIAIIALRDNQCVMVDEYQPNVSHWANKTHHRHTAGFYAYSEIARCDNQCVMVDEYQPNVSHWANKTHHRHAAGFYAHCDYFMVCCNNVIFVLSFLVSLCFETVPRNLVTSALRVYRARFPLKYLVYRQEILSFLCRIMRLLCFRNMVHGGR